MENKHYCPVCGAELKQGQYEYNHDTGNIHVVNCPECSDSEGMVVYDTENAVRKYVEENIDDFGLRYELALSVENKMRCSLQYADNILFNEIQDRIDEWCNINSHEEIPAEDIF